MKEEGLVVDSSWESEVEKSMAESSSLLLGCCGKQTAMSVELFGVEFSDFRHKVWEKKVIMEMGLNKLGIRYIFFFFLWEIGCWTKPRKICQRTFCVLIF